MRKPSRKKPVPSFDTIEKASEFWDTHSSADYDWKKAEDLSFAKAIRVYSLIKVEPGVGRALSLEAKRRRTTAERLANRILRENLKIA